MTLAKIMGVPELRAAIKQYGGQAAKGFQQGLYFGSLAIEREAKKRVPVDTGELRRNIQAVHVKGRGFYSVYMVGVATEYAVYVHENLEVKHPLHNDVDKKGRPYVRDCGGEARYLENAVQYISPYLLPLVAHEIRKAVT